MDAPLVSSFLPSCHVVRSLPSHARLLCFALPPFHTTQLEEIWEMKEAGKAYFSNYWNWFDVLATSLVWLEVWLRVGNQLEAELATLSVAAPVLWIKVLNYGRTLRFVRPVLHRVAGH